VTVAASYSRDKESADRFCESHPGTTLHQGNIGSNDDCCRVIPEVLDQHGRLDSLVDNAGITVDKMLARIPWGASVNPTRSPALWSSSQTRGRPTSPARSTLSTAACTCEIAATGRKRRFASHLRESIR